MTAMIRMQGRALWLAAALALVGPGEAVFAQDDGCRIAPQEGAAPHDSAANRKMETCMPDLILMDRERDHAVALGLAGELSPSVRWAGAYAYIDAKITEDNRLPVGIPLAAVATVNKERMRAGFRGRTKDN